MTRDEISHQAFVAYLDVVEENGRHPAVQPADAADLAFARRLFDLRYHPAAPLPPPWQLDHVTAAVVPGASGLASRLLRWLQRGALRNVARGATGARSVSPLWYPHRPEHGRLRLDAVVLTGLIAVITLTMWGALRRMAPDATNPPLPVVAPPTGIVGEATETPVAAFGPLDDSVPTSSAAFGPLFDSGPTASATPSQVTTSPAYPPPRPSSSAAPLATVTASNATLAPPPATRERTVAATTSVATNQPPYPGPDDTPTPVPRVTRIAPAPVPTLVPTVPTDLPTAPATPTIRTGPPTPTGARDPDTPTPQSGATDEPPVGPSVPATQSMPSRRIPR